MCLLTHSVALIVNEMELALVDQPVIAVSKGSVCATPKVALTVIVMELALVDQRPIAISINGVCTNTQGSFDCVRL